MQGCGEAELIPTQSTMRSEEWLQWPIVTEIPPGHHQYHGPTHFFIENGTLQLVRLPPGGKAIDSQWIFQVKWNTGSIN